MKRRTRIGVLVRETINTILQKQIQDPRLTMVTVTEVVLSADLRQAQVYVAVLGGEKKKGDSLSGLRSARTFIQRELGKQVRLKYLPVLTFLLDDTLDFADRVNDILENE